MNNREDKQDEVWVVLKQGGNTFHRYEVSNYGRVWDLKNDVAVSQVLSGKPQYLYVNLTRDDGTRSPIRRVHNIVAWSFIGEPPTPKHTVDHIDQDKFNNHVSNLRWATRREQALNRSITTICDCGTPLATLITKDYDEIAHTKTYKFMIKHFHNEIKDWSKLKEYHNAYCEYGKHWNHKVTIQGKDVLLYTLMEEVPPSISIKEVNHRLNKGITFYELLLGYVNPPLEFKDLSSSIEINGMWFKHKSTLCEYYGVSREALNDRMGKGLSLEEALSYDSMDKFKVWVDGYYMTQKGHCERLCVSHLRVSTLMSKYKISFEEAVNTPVKRVIKHAINGEIKRNHVWCELFELNAKICNSWLTRKPSNGSKRTFRQMLEHFGINTSNMEIHPCDGDVIMYNNPL